MNSFTGSVSTAFGLILSGDPVLWTVVLRSLAVSATACLLACSAGIVLGAWLGVVRFRGRDTVLTVLNTFLAIPAVVVYNWVQRRIAALRQGMADMAVALEVLLSRDLDRRAAR